jgi:hypothetical protein
MKFEMSLPPNSSAYEVTAPRRYLKDVIRAGQFFVPHMGVWLDVDRPRMDKWVAQFSRMQGNGVNVPLTTDHDQNAASVRGRLTDLFREGDELMMEVEVSDDDSAALLARCPYVSLELDKNVQDGNGASYDEAITAVTITPNPVVPGQQPFLALSHVPPADRSSGEFAADPDSVANMTDAAFGRVRPSKTPLRLGMAPSEEPALIANRFAWHDPIVANTRGILISIIGAMEKYRNYPGVEEFMDRVSSDGDLHAPLFDAVLSKVPDAATSDEIREACVSELRELFADLPPNPSNALGSFFPADAPPGLENMMDAAYGPVSKSQRDNGAGVSDAQTGQKIQVAQDSVLNGTQVTAATEIVRAVSMGDIPRDAGLGALSVLFNLSKEKAEEIMGSAGTSAPTTPNPKPASPDPASADIASAKLSRETPDDDSVARMIDFAFGRR